MNLALKTPDNQTFIIPNSPIAINALTNYSTQETRRVDFTFGIGYSDDIDKELVSHSPSRMFIYINTNKRS